ncbi:hypothetical protein L227DRAFT_195266 [Lentinus tigrinus ALCF2SS1-6]|uniref:Uncharacterized protein n=1 Tax=Lentinus tigrinus ALCF2SS1-6 TaxID=1328759 RepID=A0A5C2S365_9APHY|nr:hypothetical protein L227DRAFT_195266 [Lentinus tigrinus ALCF2SS1-6]
MREVRRTHHTTKSESGSMMIDDASPTPRAYRSLVRRLHQPRPLTTPYPHRQTHPGTSCPLRHRQGQTPASRGAQQRCSGSCPSRRPRSRARACRRGREAERERVRQTRQGRRTDARRHSLGVRFGCGRIGDGHIGGVGGCGQDGVSCGGARCHESVRRPGWQLGIGGCGEGSVYGRRAACGVSGQSVRGAKGARTCIRHR